MPNPQVDSIVGFITGLIDAQVALIDNLEKNGVLIKAPMIESLKVQIANAEVSNRPLPWVRSLKLILWKLDGTPVDPDSIAGLLN